MPLLRMLRPTLPILIGASIMLTLSMGLRQSLGIFLQPLTHDVGISVSDFSRNGIDPNGADPAQVKQAVGGFQYPLLHALFFG